MNNRVGHMRAPEFHRVALGTDGIGGDMFEESKAAFWRAREADPATTPQFALDTLGTSARFAARVVGEPLLGSLDPGAPADLLVLEYAPPTPLTSENLAGHWVFGLSSRMVRDVYVAGEPVVLGRRLTRVEKREVTARTAGQARRLWARMDEIDEHPFDPATGWEAEG
jgi:cytosine/adenosine deaminase-related metal-dependent hydrolase